MTANTLPSNPSYLQRGAYDPYTIQAGRRQSPFLAVTFFVPVLLSFVAWIGGGIQFLTDLSMTIMTGLAVVILLVEIVYFPIRFGTAACTLFGGVIIWLSYDYFTNWFGADYSFSSRFSAETIAKAVFNTTLWVAAAACGMLIPVPRKAEKLFTWVPEAPHRDFYLGLAVVMFLIGMTPYLFNTADPFHVSVWKELTGGRVRWTSGRSGNVNFNFGAYWAQVKDVGEMAGLLGAAYAIFLANTAPKKLLGWAIWGFYFAVALQGSRRSPVVFMMLPPTLFLYIKYQAQARMLFKRYSVKAFVFAGIMLLTILVIAEIKIQRRGAGEVRYSIQEVVEVEGNSMFSESLVGFATIPDQVSYFFDWFPGSAAIMPIPKMVYDFVIGPIPRAIWKGKPVDPIWKWYNEATMGTTMKGQSYHGTTVAQGAVGYWFIRGGPVAVFQGGMLVGWFIALLDRVIRHNLHRLVVVIFAFGVLTFMFRAFRGINFHALYPVLIGIVALSGVNILLKKFFTKPS